MPCFFKKKKKLYTKGLKKWCVTNMTWWSFKLIFIINWHLWLPSLQGSHDWFTDTPSFASCLSLCSDGQNGVPVTDASVWLSNDLLPMLSACLVGYSLPNIHYSDNVVSRKTIIVHGKNFHGQITNVDVCNVELERLVEDGDESVTFDLWFPLLEALSFV